MFSNYSEYVKFRNSSPVGKNYDAAELANRLKPLYIEGWNSKKIAEKTGISSIASIHKASLGEVLTKNEFIDGQWIKVIDDENLSKLVNFLNG